MVWWVLNLRLAATIVFQLGSTGGGYNIGELIPFALIGLCGAIHCILVIVFGDVVDVDFLVHHNKHGECV